MFLSFEEKEVLASENYALNYYVAKMFYSRDIPEDELVSVALLGFTKALNAFDKTRGVKFSTYAINCIRNEILFFLRKERKHIENVSSFNKILATDQNGRALSLEDTVLNQEVGQDYTQNTVMINNEIDLLREAMTYLTQREQYILLKRYGIDNHHRLTQKELAEEIGMSQANISKIEKIIHIKLRQILRDKYRLIDTLIK